MTAGFSSETSKVVFEEATPSEWGKLPPGIDSLFAKAGYNLVKQLTSQESVQLVLTKHIPWQLVETYRRAAIRRAQPRALEDGSWYAEIPGFEGVWANEENLRDCLNTLDEVLLDWLLLKIEAEDRDIPSIEGIDLNVL